MNVDPVSSTTDISRTALLSSFEYPVGYRLFSSDAIVAATTSKRMLMCMKMDITGIVQRKCLCFRLLYIYNAGTNYGTTRTALVSACVKNFHILSNAFCLRVLESGSWTKFGLWRLTCKSPWGLSCLFPAPGNRPFWLHCQTRKLTYLDFTYSLFGIIKILLTSYKEYDLQKRFSLMTKCYVVSTHWNTSTFVVGFLIEYVANLMLLA